MSEIANAAERWMCEKEVGRGKKKRERRMKERMKTE